MRKLNEMEQADNLDAALDQFLTSQEKFNTADWAGALSRRLLELDNAFASSSESGAESSRVPITFGIEGSLPRTPMVNWEAPLARRLPLNGWIMAAVLAIAAFGLGLFGSNRGWWSGNDNRPTGASIAAVSTSAATAVVSEMVVTPSTCTLEPLTRERYDAIVGTATPLPLEDFQADLAARTDAFGKKLDLRVVDGDVVITAGSELPPDVARELEATLSSWIACGNAGNELALSGIMSDDYIRMINDPETWFAEIEATQEVTPTQVIEMKFEQVRLLADGSVVAVVMDFITPSDGAAEEPEEMPTGTVAIQGMIYLFVPKSKGWRLDFAQSGYVLPIKNEAISATPVPDAEYVNEMVVTPSACTFEPLTRAQLGQIVGTATPISDEEYDNLQVAMTNELLPALDLKVVDGNVLITGGSAVPREMADEVANVLASFIACGNAGDLPAAIRILSDEFLARMPDQDQFLADLESPSTPEAEPLAELHVTQLRLLPDGRIILTWAIDISSFSGIEYSPEPTPQGTVALDGILLVFVKDTDGWKVDFQRGGEIFQLQVSDEEGLPGGTPTSGIELVVSPSTCTLEPMTLERYDAIVGSATPLSSEEDYDRLLEAKVEELLPALEMKLINGAVVITGGSAVSEETLAEVGELLSSFIACGNEGDYLARLGLFSDSFVKAISRESILEMLSGTPIAVGTILSDMRFQQMRLLDDGLLIMVWTNSPSDDTTGVPISTPEGTVVIDGEVMVFVMTSDGWRFEFGQSGDHFLLPADDEGGTPVSTQAVVEEMVVTPSSCTLEPLTQESYAEIVGTATPIVDEAIVDAGIVMSNALKAELDAQVDGGQFDFHGGSAVPSEIADEIRQSAASYLGCWNDGNFLATLEFLTDDLLMATQDLRRWQESIALVRPGEENTLPEMRLAQLRLLSDGRVAAVWAGPFPDNSFELIPLLGTETPDGTIRTDGPIYVFKLTSQGWRLNWIEAAGLYQLPPPLDQSSERLWQIEYQMTVDWECD